MLYLNHILNNAKNAKIQYAVALRAADMWWCGVQSSHICVSSFFEVVQLLAFSTFAHSYAVHFWVYLRNLRFRGPIQAKTSISFFAFRLCLLLNAVCTSLVHSARSNERSQKFRFATPTENDNNNDKRLKLTEPKLRIGARLPAAFQPQSLSRERTKLNVMRNLAGCGTRSSPIGRFSSNSRRLQVPPRKILRRDGRNIHAYTEVCLSLSLLSPSLIHLWKICSWNLHYKQSSYGLDLRGPWSSHHNMEQHHCLGFVDGFVRAICPATGWKWKSYYSEGEKDILFGNSVDWVTRVE